MRKNPNRAWLQDIDDKLKKMIEDHGIAIIGTAFPDGTPYLHTIGMQAEELPELVLTGLPSHQGHDAINKIGKSLLAGHCKPTPGMNLIVEAFNSDIAWKIGSVSAPWCREYMNKLNRFYPKTWRPGNPDSVVQLIWPDEHGRYPGPLWSLGDAQPLLDVWAHPRDNYRLN